MTTVSLDAPGAPATADSSPFMLLPWRDIVVGDVIKVCVLPHVCVDMCVQSV